MISLHKPNTYANFRLPQLHSKEFETTITKRKEKKPHLRCFYNSDSTAENDRLFLFFLPQFEIFYEEV